MIQRFPGVPVEQALEIGRELGVDATRSSRNWFRALAHNPHAAKGVCVLVDALLFHNTIPTRLRELMILRIAWVTGSEYEWSQHWRIARAAGLSEEDVLATQNWRASTRMTPTDRAVLAAVDDTLQFGKVSNDVWEECANQLGGPAELVEMMLIIGNWTMFSQFLQSMEVPLEEGLTTWPPKGIAPDRDTKSSFT